MSSEVDFPNLNPRDTHEGTDIFAVFKNKSEGFVAVGQALKQVREDRQYLDGYPNWDAYCKATVGCSKTQANRIINASDFVIDLTESGRFSDPIVLPENESQVRPVLAIKDPDARLAVWQEISRRANGNNLTAALINGVINQCVPGLSETTRQPTKKTNINAGAADSLTNVEVKEQVAFLEKIAGLLERGTEEGNWYFVEEVLEIVLATIVTEEDNLGRVGN